LEKLPEIHIFFQSIILQQTLRSLIEFMMDVASIWLRSLEIAVHIVVFEKFNNAFYCFIFTRLNKYFLRGCFLSTWQSSLIKSSFHISFCNLYYFFLIIPFASDLKFFSPLKSRKNDVLKIRRVWATGTDGCRREKLKSSLHIF
jgi:hypothetical protein